MNAADLHRNGDCHGDDRCPVCATETPEEAPMPTDHIAAAARARGLVVDHIEEDAVFVDLDCGAGVLLYVADPDVDEIEAEVSWPTWDYETGPDSTTVATATLPLSDALSWVVWYDHAAALVQDRQEALFDQAPDVDEHTYMAGIG